MQRNRVDFPEPDDPTSAVTVPGGLFMSVVVGSVVTLASVAPWLALGMVLTVIITWTRGLPRCIRELRQELGSG